jgi:hypothetical protein
MIPAWKEQVILFIGNYQLVFHRVFSDFFSEQFSDSGPRQVFPHFGRVRATDHAAG